MIKFPMRWPLAAAAGAVLALGTVGAIAQQVAATGSAEIVIQNFHFLPPTLAVAAGTAVTWSNHDEEPHNVVNAPDAGQPRIFRSQAIDGGDKYTFVFDKPGTYKYICAVHPHMQGTVIVQ
jgi:plastocyanin